MDREQEEGKEKVLIFKALHQYPETVLYPVSDNAKALLQFARKTSILPNDIGVLNRLGFKVVMQGHTREYEEILKNHDINYQRTQGGLEC